MEETTIIVPLPKFPEMVSLLSPSGKTFKDTFRYFACNFFVIFFAKFSAEGCPITK